MAAKIRLKRTGKKKQCFYRIVVVDSRSPRDGRVIEEIGFYNPHQDPAEVKVDVERLQHWLDNGATPTPKAESILKNRIRETADRK